MPSVTAAPLASLRSEEATSPLPSVNSEVTVVALSAPPLPSATAVKTPNPLLCGENLRNSIAAVPRVLPVFNTLLNEEH